MVHPVISHIQSHMGDVGSGVVGGVEKDQIPCFCFGQGDVLRHIVLFLSCPWQDVLLVSQYLTVAQFDDETVQAITEEALKYEGWTYVYGGDSPSTSFDCSRSRPA